MRDRSATADATAGAPEGGVTRRTSVAAQLRTHRGVQGSVTFLAFLAVFVIYTIWLGSNFANADARLLDIHQNAPVILLGLSVLVTLVAGQFDLSVASLATLSTFLTVGLPVQHHWPFGLVVVVCLLAGALTGLVNGLLVVRLHVSTFIATLGTGGIVLGLSSVYSKGAQISPPPGTSLPSWFSGPHSLGAYGQKIPSVFIWVALAALAVAIFFELRWRLLKWGAGQKAPFYAAGITVLAAVVLLLLNISAIVDKISWTIGVVAAFTFALWVVMGYTTFGRHVLATGSNSEAARLAGVKPGRETVNAFIVGGVIAACAGVLLAANQASASPDIAGGFLLPAFAAAFLSTAILSTGRFTVIGTTLGGIFLVWVSQGLIVGGLAFTWTDVVNGLVLLIAVAVSTAFRRSS